MAPRSLTVLVSCVLVGGAAFLGGISGRGVTVADGAPSPVFDEAFWGRWGDGRAELASYDLTFPRYGSPRSGVAIAICVTETFSEEARVKADPGKHAKTDEFPVMKLNLVQNFPTGLYDYSLMTSAFSALAPRPGLPAGSVAKVSFSAQEWCGHVYAQALPAARSVAVTSHSYFDGEADQSETMEHPAGAVFEDALLLWARGFAAPRLEPGQSVGVRLFRSLETARLRHRPFAWEPATLARAAAPTTVTVPAGTFEVETLSADIGGDLPRTWTIQVETAEPHRLVRWETSDGNRAELVAAERLRYWEMNGPESLEQLARLGLSPRPPRTP